MKNIDPARPSRRARFQWTSVAVPPKSTDVVLGHSSCHKQANSIGKSPEARTLNGFGCYRRNIQNDCSKLPVDCAKIVAARTAMTARASVPVDHNQLKSRFRAHMYNLWPSTNDEELHNEKLRDIATISKTGWDGPGWENCPHIAFSSATNNSSCRTFK